MQHDYTRRFRALAGTATRQPIRAETPTDGGDGTVAVFRLYDPVDSWGGEWGVSAKEFAAALDELPDTVNTIRLHVNSPGGEVFEGIAILNALRARDARLVAVVDGIAASAASFIAAGADELIMARNAELMIHDAWGLCVGNAADMRDLADKLDRVSNNIASIYADKSGGDVATWREAMAAETWYSAQEAVDAGLADRVDKKRSADGAKDRFDLSIYTYAGRDAAPGPQQHERPATLPGSGWVSPDDVRESEIRLRMQDPAPSTEATDPDDAEPTPPEDAADEVEGELQLVAKSLEHLARAI